jgi:hypothetical protein
MLDTAIVTTTINYPKTFVEKYASTDALLIVVGDEKTPPETEELVTQHGGRYLPSYDQNQWQCSVAIGWNKIQRRNIGFLEAYRLGADVVITVDDDNLPENADVWLAGHKRNLSDYVENTVTTNIGWFNPGWLLNHQVQARGFPYFVVDRPLDFNSGTSKNPVGVSAGLWLGDPDVDAMTRIVQGLETYELRGPDRSVIEPGTWAPINSQNTAWRRDLLPLTFLPPYVGRWDDILGGYVAQWSLWAAGYSVAYGQPLVRQDRNEHNLWKDLADEIAGYEYTTVICDMLAQNPASGEPLADLELFSRLFTKEQFGKWDVYRVNNFIHRWIEDWTALI